MFHVKHFLLQRFTLCQQEKIIGGPITHLSVMTHKAYGVAIRPPIKGYSVWSYRASVLSCRVSHHSHRKSCFRHRARNILQSLIPFCHAEPQAKHLPMPKNERKIPRFAQNDKSNTGRKILRFAQNDREEYRQEDSSLCSE